jgi:hypothetical protein
LKRGSTQFERKELHAQEIKTNVKAITIHCEYLITQKLSRDEVIIWQERGKVILIVSLNPRDLGNMLYGQLSEDGCAATNSPIAPSRSRKRRF